MTTYNVYACGALEPAHRVHMYKLDFGNWCKLVTEYGLTAYDVPQGLYVDRRGGMWYVKEYK